MRVSVLYFGVLKDLLGRADENLVMAENSTVAQLLDQFRQTEVGPAGLWDSLAVAVNQAYARGDWALHEGDEVALLPPVSGGATDAN